MRWSSWDFNSIKVRLERRGGDPRLPVCRDFNSIKVRLEHLYVPVSPVWADISIP